MAQFTSHNPAGQAQISASDLARIEPFDVLELFKVVWRGKWIILLTTTLALVLAGYYAFAIASPRYAATSTLHVDTSRIVLADGAGSGARSQVNLNTEMAILTSRHLLDQVIDRLDLQNDPAFNRYLTPVSAWSLTGLRTQTRNRLMGVTETPPDANAIRAKTVENMRRVIAVQPQRDSSVLAVRVTTGSAVTSALIANTLAEIYLADQVTAQFSTTENAVAWLSGKVFELQVELAQKETAITDLITRAQINDEASLDAISRQATETDTRLHEARMALSKIETSLISANAVPPGIDDQGLRNQIAALEAFRANLTTQLAERSESLVELQHLRREADATRVLYETFLTRLQDVSLQSGLNTPNSRVLNAAEPGHYVAPRKMLILAMATVFGAALGVALAFLRDATRRRLQDAEQLLESTGLPVMAKLPAKGLNRTAALDAARTLRTALQYEDAEDPAQVILCTSSIAGEGQDDMARLLAQALDGIGKSVLLFDGDLRIARSGPDLGAIMDGKQALSDAITPADGGTIDLLTATAGMQHPADLFCGRPFVGFLNRLREHYDHIVIMAPPVLPTPDTPMLAQHSDTVLYAVRSNSTKPQLIMEGQRILAGVQAPVTGLVMTGANLRKQPEKAPSIWPAARRAPMGA